MEDNVNAIGYIRVSTEEQSREGISLEMQAAKIRAYCELNDLSLTEIVEDAGISGKTIKARPGVQKVLQLVKSKKVAAVVVYKFDRLARNTIEALDVARAMNKADVALHSISEKLDTQSALWRFFFTLTASLAEMERNLIAERTSEALKQKRSNGQKTGGYCPYGFTAVEGLLIPDQTEQGTVSAIRGLKEQGLSTRAMVKVLGLEGIRTRKGTHSTQTQVCRILRAA
jgi:site-specific DNA recombinase